MGQIKRGGGGGGDHKERNLNTTTIENIEDYPRGKQKNIKNSISLGD